MRDVENTFVEFVSDGYAVKVSIKDNSLYAYVSRRFAYAERVEMKKIVDE